MTRPTIGGVLDVDALRRLHRPAHAFALDDARDHLRRALAAVAGCQHPSRDAAAELARLHAALADGLEQLDRLRGAP